MKYTTKNPPLIDAIGFEELVAYGVEQGAPLINGMPWSFDYKEYHVTHESDDCYLVGACRFERGQFLVSGPGEISRAISAEDLRENYTPEVPEAPRTEACYDRADAIVAQFRREDLRAQATIDELDAECRRLERELGIATRLAARETIRAHDAEEKLNAVT